MENKTSGWFYLDVLAGKRRPNLWARCTNEYSESERIWFKRMHLKLIRLYRSPVFKVSKGKTRWRCTAPFCREWGLKFNTWSGEVSNRTMWWGDGRAGECVGCCACWEGKQKSWRVAGRVSKHDMAHNATVTRVKRSSPEVGGIGECRVTLWDTQ